MWTPGSPFPVRLLLLQQQWLIAGRMTSAGTELGRKAALWDLPVSPQRVPPGLRVGLHLSVGRLCHSGEVTDLPPHQLLRGSLLLGGKEEDSINVGLPG